MTSRLSTKARNLLASSLGFGSIFANGVIDIYTGTQPASADAAPTGTKIGRITLSSGAFVQGTATNGLTFGTAVDGVLPKSGVWSFNGISPGGTAGWFRISANATADNVTDDSTAKLIARADGSCAVSGGDMNLSQLVIATGAPTTVDSFAWTQPA